MSISDEEEKQEDIMVEVDPNELTEIAMNQAGLHDSDPDVVSDAGSDASPASSEDLPDDQDATTSDTSKKKGWNRVTLALVFAVVALAAALVIVVPVLLTRGDSSPATTGGATELTTEKQLVDTNVVIDRQVPTVTPPQEPSNPPAVAFTDSPVVSQSDLPVNAPTTRAPVTFAPAAVDEEKPPVVMAPVSVTPNSRPPFQTFRPSSYASSPVDFAPSFYQMQCGIDCNGKPCGLANLGSEEIVCCSDWSTVDIWNNGRVESYCWGSFPMGAACVDSWDGDYMCRSSICNKGVCSTSRGAAGDKCTNSRNCTNGCGQETLDSSSGVCCSTYESSFFNGSTYISYCAGSFDFGETCFGSDQCDSYICVEGKCASQRQQAGGSCTNSDECSNYACGVGSLNSTASASSDKICCPSGSTYSIWNGDNYFEYCAYSVLTGEQCIADELCQSGICINETSTKSICSDRRLPDGSTCYTDNHCQNYGCGFASFPPTSLSNKTCCPNGRYDYVYFEGSYDYIQACARSILEGQACDADQSGDVLCETGFCVQGICSRDRLANGEECSRYNDCQSEQCGLNADDIDSLASVCCEETFGIYNSNTYDYLNFCVRTVPTGGSCDVGYDGGYGEGDYNDDGYGVDSSILCASGICIQGTCSDDFSKAGEPCNRNTECANNACAFSVFDVAERERVCCAGQALYFYDSSYNNGKYYCERTVPSGGQCPNADVNYDSFRVCESGICLNELCSDNRQADGELCNNSNDCESQACGLDSVAFATRKKICCTAGKTIGLTDGFDYNDYCMRNIPLGGKCLSANANNYRSDGGQMCESGICIDDVCVDTRLADSESCNIHNECDSGACGYDSLDFSLRKKVCCESICSNQLYDGFDYEDYW